jgi:VanZ family protein
MAVIFTVSSLPAVPTLPGGLSNHTGHFIGYAILGALVLRALARATWAGVTARAAAGAWLVSAAYGVTDEVHQQFVAGRTVAVDDWIADALGAAAAAFAIYAAARFVAGRTGRPGRSARTRAV